MPAYTASCATDSIDSSTVPTPRRSAAVTPATPKEERWKTATMYARSPTLHMR